MQTKSVQEGGKTFHQHEDAHSEARPGSEDEVKDDAAVPVLEDETLAQDHHPQHFGELCLSRQNLNNRASLFSFEALRE